MMMRMIDADDDDDDDDDNWTLLLPSDEHWRPDF